MTATYNPLETLKAILAESGLQGDQPAREAMVKAIRAHEDAEACGDPYAILAASYMAEAFLLADFRSKLVRSIFGKSDATLSLEQIVVAAGNNARRLVELETDLKNARGELRHVQANADDWGGQVRKAWRFLRDSSRISPEGGPIEGLIAWIGELVSLVESKQSELDQVRTTAQEMLAQVTVCARCEVFKHTPWKATEGYICAACLGAVAIELAEILKEFHEEGIAVLDEKTRTLIGSLSGVAVEDGPFDHLEAKGDHHAV